MHANTTSGAADYTLAGALWPQTTTLGRLIRMAVLAIAGAALLTLAAKIRVPFYPVPMTLQTLMVPLIACAYGSRLGAATILLYIAEGMAGLPVFTNTPPLVASPAYLLGPTGGYLAGWVGAAFLVGYLAERGYGSTLPRLIGIIFLGSIITFICGVSWLAYFASMSSGANGIGLMPAIKTGYVLFILGDIVKVTLAAAIVRGSWTLIGKSR